ncbi:TonB-dependent receptor plug domain-containing protein [Sphingobacterium sp. LRF_L2]|uniref:TonB-dependent receptor plug domain-containing protein n=1 Tax=Sphingobacterium sp. LRF_L2 TaxID=3369421 RepID=UPI003F60F50B
MNSLLIRTLSFLPLFVCWMEMVQAQIVPDTVYKPIGEVIIYGNRLQIPFEQQNRNIQILDRQQIEALPAKSINELLTYVSGVDIRQRGPFGSQADISIDGGSFEQTLVLVNGVKMLDAQTAHNTLNLPIPVDAIERIEIIRGPAARLYGINSLTGAINIVTRKPSHSEVLAHTYAGTGFKRDTSNNDELFNGRGVQLGGSLVGRLGRHAIYGSHESGNGYRYNTAFRNNKIFYEGEVPTNATSALSLMGGYVDSDFGANGFYAAPGDKESQEVVQTIMAAISYRTKLSERFSLTPRVSYRYTYDDYRYFRNDLSRARSQHYGHALNAEVNSIYQTNIGDFGAGVEMRRETISSSNIGVHDRNNYGMYAEFKTQRIANVLLNVGAYINYNSDYGWEVFPGIDLGYKLNDNWQIVAHTGTGQRIPSFTDLYLNQTVNVGNPSVLPERAWHMEGGMKYLGEHLSGQARYFYRNIRDFIDWVRSGEDMPYQPLNFSGNRVHGISSNVNYQFSKPSDQHRWSAGLAYTWLSPSIDQNDADEVNSKYAIESLRQQLTGNINWGFKGFSATVAGRFNERISYKSYFLADARFAYRFKPMELYVDAQNIFNMTYIEAAAVPMPGRWVSLGARFRFVPSKSNHSSLK